MRAGNDLVLVAAIAGHRRLETTRHDALLFRPDAGPPGRRRIARSPGNLERSGRHS
jgi:hypothetical protein